MSENYLYAVWTQNGAVTAYITDPSHNPPQWQETLEGQRKAQAIALVTEDKLEAGNEGFYQYTINEGKRLYQRTSKDTGNSWEVMYDESWQEIPWPGTIPEPIPVFTKDLAEAKVVIRTFGSRVVILITGTVVS